ncbi:MAG: HAD family hydrolase, partial [Bacteroidales bacterium]
DLLEYIKKQNLKSIVFSNKPDEITQKIIKQLFINHSFDFVLGASEALPTKPQPNGIFYICSKLGLNPTDLLYIGDSDVDMITAKNAGMKSIGATWGFRTENELINSGAWKIAHHPNEIINFL